MKYNSSLGYFYFELILPGLFCYSSEMVDIAEYSCHLHHNTGHYRAGEADKVWMKYVLFDLYAYFVPDFEHFLNSMFVQKHGQENSGTGSVSLTILSHINGDGDWVMLSDINMKILIKNKISYMSEYNLYEKETKVNIKTIPTQFLIIMVLFYIKRIKVYNDKVAIMNNGKLNN